MNHSDNSPLAAAPFYPLHSSCPMSDDSDTAFGDDSSVTDIGASPASVSDAELIDDDQQLSMSVMDKSDCLSQSRENQFDMYLQAKESSDVKKTTNGLLSPSFSGDVENEFECLVVRRSTSLKTYKTPPGSPHRKKEVRFADALGLDLESVRHIINTNEPPMVPASAMRDLKVESSSVNTRRRILHPCFPQPGLSPNFAARVDERRVALHSFRADYDVVSGTICVANIAYEKRVLVRFTFDGWVTYSDVIASYVDGSNTGSTDLFRFSIQLPESCGTKCSFVEFSIMFMAGSSNEVYWDSNFGSNYRVDCYFS